MFDSPLAAGPEVDEHIIKEFAVEGLHSGHDNDVKIVTQIPIHVIKEIQMIKKYKYVYIKEFAAGWRAAF